ncbi:hypothetical protein BCU40_025870 [Vibrio lentus]
MGSPNEDIDGKSNVGMVTVLYGGVTKDSIYFRLSIIKRSQY